MRLPVFLNAQKYNCFEMINSCSWKLMLTKQKADVGNIDQEIQQMLKLKCG